MPKGEDLSGASCAIAGWELPLAGKCQLVVLSRRRLPIRFFDRRNRWWRARCPRKRLKTEPANPGSKAKGWRVLRFEDEVVSGRSLIRPIFASCPHLIRPRYARPPSPASWRRNFFPTRPLSPATDSPCSRRRPASRKSPSGTGSTVRPGVKRARQVGVRDEELAPGRCVGLAGSRAEPRPFPWSVPHWR